MLVGKTGAYLFLQKKYGPLHPLTVQAKGFIEDERIFSAFLGSLLDELGALYQSSIAYSEKLLQREQIFADYTHRFSQISHTMKTDYFAGFGRSRMNNAYLLSIGLYHRHFSLFEAILTKQNNSIKDTLTLFSQLAKKKGNLLNQANAWLVSQRSNDKLSQASFKRTAE